MNNVHPTSIIHEGCEIDENVTIGAYSIIGPNVKIGKNSKIHSHVLIDGNTIIGHNNEIYSFSVIGSNPSKASYQTLSVFKPCIPKHSFNLYLSSECNVLPFLNPSNTFDQRYS